MLLSFLAPFIALAAAAVAGDTWDSAGKGRRRLTRTGWPAIGVALAGFGLSSVAAYDKYEDQKARRAAVIDEIDLAWRGLASPYRMMSWEIDGEQSSPDADLITKMKYVATDYMIQAMKVLSPCGKWEPNLAAPLRLESLTNFRDLPRYRLALLALRKELDEG